jgi:hypothetical protein
MWDRRHSTTPHVAGVLGTFGDGVGNGSTSGDFGTNRVMCLVGVFVVESHAVTVALGRQPRFTGMEMRDLSTCPALTFWDAATSNNLISCSRRTRSLTRHALKGELMSRGRTLCL